MRLTAITLAALAALSLSAFAQQNTPPFMGTVLTSDAVLSGGLEVHGDVARLVSNANVSAYEHTAPVALARGGNVLVCSTSGFHLLRSGGGDSLLFALDRGAIEIHTDSRPQDAILTPDLRFTMLTAGPLDLRLRVTREGDTCVENRGDTAPVLQIREGFGDATYHLAPGQHVLFEHGSLHEVVDREQSNCGCPAATPAMVAATSPNATSTASPQQAAALNPFPAAQSADLAPTKPTVPIPPAGSAVTTDLSYSAVPGAASPPAPQQTVARAQEPSAVTTGGSTTPPPSPPGAHDIAHKIGRFFHHLFHPNS